MKSVIFKKMKLKQANQEIGMLHRAENGWMEFSVSTGIIAVQAEPTWVANFGLLERWDGNSGPGNLNA